MKVNTKYNVDETVWMRWRTVRSRCKCCDTVIETFVGVRPVNIKSVDISSEDNFIPRYYVSADGTHGVALDLSRSETALFPTKAEALEILGLPKDEKPPELCNHCQKYVGKLGRAYKLACEVLGNSVDCPQASEDWSECPMDTGAEAYCVFERCWSVYLLEMADKPDSEIPCDTGDCKKCLKT